MWSILYRWSILYVFCVFQYGCLAKFSNRLIAGPSFSRPNLFCFDLAWSNHIAGKYISRNGYVPDWPKNVPLLAFRVEPPRIVHYRDHLAGKPLVFCQSVPDMCNVSLSDRKLGWLLISYSLSDTKELLVPLSKNCGFLRGQWR